MERIVWAARSNREARPKIPAKTEKKLLALVLLMRYSYFAGEEVSARSPLCEEASVDILSVIVE